MLILSVVCVNICVYIITHVCTAFTRRWAGVLAESRNAVLKAPRVQDKLLDTEPV